MIREKKQRQKTKPPSLLKHYSMLHRESYSGQLGMLNTGTDPCPCV